MLIQFPLGLLKEILLKQKAIHAAQIANAKVMVKQIYGEECKKTAHRLRKLKQWLNETSVQQRDERKKIIREINRLKSDLQELKGNAEREVSELAMEFIDVKFFCVLRPTLSDPEGLVVEAIDFNTAKTLSGEDVRVVQGGVKEGKMVWHGGEIPFQVVIDGALDIEVLPFDKNLDLLRRAGTCFKILAEEFGVSLENTSPTETIKQIDSIIRQWKEMGLEERSILIKKESLSKLQFKENLDEVPSFESLRREISALDYLLPLFKKATYQIHGRVDPVYRESIANEAIEKTVRNRFRQGLAQAERYAIEAAKGGWREGFKGAILTSIHSDLGRIVEKDLNRSGSAGDKKELLVSFRTLLTELGIDASLKDLWQSTLDEKLYPNDLFWEQSEDLLEKRAMIAKALLNMLPELKEKLKTGKHHREARAVEMVRRINAAIESGLEGSTLEDDIRALIQKRVLGMEVASDALDKLLVQTMLSYADVHETTVSEAFDVDKALAEAHGVSADLRSKHHLSPSAPVFFLIAAKHKEITLHRPIVQQFADYKELFGKAKAYLARNHGGRLEDYINMLELLDDHLVELATNASEKENTFDSFLLHHWCSPISHFSKLNQRIGEHLHFERK